jgi:hypothetical protein
MKQPRSRQLSGRWCAVAKTDWSRPLAKPIDIGGRRKLRTLDDVRAHLLKIPEERQTNVIWQKMTQDIMDAAKSGETLDLTIPFALARMMRH